MEVVNAMNAGILGDFDKTTTESFGGYGMGSGGSSGYGMEMEMDGIKMMAMFLKKINSLQKYCFKQSSTSDAMCASDFGMGGNTNLSVMHRVLEVMNMYSNGFLRT